MSFARPDSAWAGLLRPVTGLAYWSRAEVSDWLWLMFDFGHIEEESCAHNCETETVAPSPYEIAPAASVGYHCRCCWSAVSCSLQSLSPHASCPL